MKSSFIERRALTSARTATTLKIILAGHLGLTSANLDLTFRGGNITQWLAYLPPDPAALGSISRQKKLSTLLRLIYDAG